MQFKQTPWWGKIGLLWLLFLPLCMAIYVLLQPLAPNDFWYHLRAGAWITEHHTIPTIALFTQSVPPGTPYFYQSWIAEVFMYLIFKWGSLSWTQVARALIFTGSFAAFIAIAFSRAKVLLLAHGENTFNQAARRVAIASLAGLFMCIPNLDWRPQTFSWPLFAIFVAIIFSWTNVKGYLLPLCTGILVALTTLWANTHGAFATGIVLLILFFIGETFYYFGGKRFIPWFGEKLEKTQLLWLYIATIGSVISACINIKGVGIYAYVYQLTNNAINKKYIQEWQPPNWSDGVNSLFFCAGIAIIFLIALLVARRYSPDYTMPSPIESTFGLLGVRFSELLIGATFFVMGMRNVRSIVWFGLISTIIFTAFVCRAFAGTPIKVLSPVSPIMRRCNGIIAILIIGITIPFLPWIKPFFPWPSAYLRDFAPTSHGKPPVDFSAQPPLLLSNQTPVGAVAFLQQSPPAGLIWSDMVYGSYLTWALYPQRGAWADPRIELRPDAFWHQYIKTCAADSAAIRWLQNGEFTDVLINKTARIEKPLKNALHKLPLWRVVYEDHNSILFRRD